MDRRPPVLFSAMTAAALLCAAAFWPARAQQNADGPKPIVVELFASQSCSSCVAAADLVTDLAAREDVVVLSWHVDYWNKLQTANGRWADPYSDPACTKRQRAYNKNIRQRSTVYTPQMIVNGTMEAVGSARNEIEDLIGKARKDASDTRVIARRKDGRLAFHVSDAEADAEAWLVTFKPKVETAIARGENAGVAYEDANVVTGMRRLGAIGSGGAAHFTAEPPEGDERCAVIVQTPEQGAIAAGAYCAKS